MDILTLLILGLRITDEQSAFDTTRLLVVLLVYVLVAAAYWRVFTKAGVPGVLAIIPVVNVVMLVKIAGLSGWLALVYLVPVANAVLGAVVAYRVGRSFGHGPLFSLLLLWLLPMIGYAIVGFGRDRYVPVA